MRLVQATQGHRPAYVHNPKDFYPNSFRVEVEGRRLILVGVVKRHLKKNFRIVAILKPL